MEEKQAAGRGRKGVIDLPVGVGDGIYRIAGIILQKESRRGQTLSWWREKVVVKGACERAGGGVGKRAGWLAGWQAGRVGGGPCIDSQPLSSSLSPTHGSRERERDRERESERQGGRGVTDGRREEGYP